MGSFEAGWYIEVTDVDIANIAHDLSKLKDAAWEPMVYHIWGIEIPKTTLDSVNSYLDTLGEKELTADTLAEILSGDRGHKYRNSILDVAWL